MIILSRQRLNNTVNGHSLIVMQGLGVIMDKISRDQLLRHASLKEMVELIEKQETATHGIVRTHVYRMFVGLINHSGLLSGYPRA